MSKQFPIVAVTGSSGAGTTEVRKTFESIFKKLNITAAIVEGDSYHKYERDQLIWPVFIGEVAYKEKKIAMSYTKKEVIFSTKKWVQEFASL